ncbi:MAG TPA: glycoside hydrolase family 9 protein [Bacteroidales bacterium]|nr:glycoside hydrolase family 9 protein [Bacteroidales bacterium]
MKMRLFCILILATVLGTARGQSWIRINQLGYLPHSVKVAVLISTDEIGIGRFEVCDAVSGKVAFTGKASACSGNYWGMKTAARLDFSDFVTPGGYYIKAGNVTSESFRVNNDVYNGTADYILNYLRQQRCGYNPFLNDSCHTHDGALVDHPTETGKRVDVVGGWHDASDHLRYTTTSANTVYQLLYAWSKSPGVYKDEYDADGRRGKNGIPDILDEARWGLQWLMKMNPDSGIMYNQVADDRDHRGFRLPNQDTATYGLGKCRPVYFVTGKSQGLSKYKNRTTGVSSTAGKFSSAFAIGSRIFASYDTLFAQKLAAKARDAWEFGLTDLGTTQTACTVSPYFYEEDNYVDDLELAAWEMYKLTNDKQYLTRSDYWGTLEPVTPWIERDTARHYQYYPFVNLGHANIALSGTDYASKYRAYMRKGLTILESRNPQDPFHIPIPFIWCSNNYIAAALTQCHLYYEATGDSRFSEMEAAMRDWLFGCNPWGTSMISGIPAGGDYPVLPHSAVTKYLHVPPPGGLVDGPVYKRIYTNLSGLTLFGPDTYSDFQNGNVVYHDDMGDYSTNEPTLDGTASLSYYLSTLEKEGRSENASHSTDITDDNGAVIRKNSDQKVIYLIFSADSFGDGAEHILNTLEKRNIKGSFFLTGNYLRDKKNSSIVKRMVAGDHFIGPHSDNHLLYASWEKRDSLLVTRKLFEDDLRANYAVLAKAGYKGSDRYFLPPYEWYNKAIASWTDDMGITLINFTPGTGTNADYTTPDMKNYISSDQLLQRLKTFEEKNNMNGAFLLIHLGTSPARTDKFYLRLDDIIQYFSDKGYKFLKLQ